MTRPLRYAPALLLLGALSCADGPLAPLEPCTGPVIMTVTNDPKPPRVRWTPRCGAAELTVAGSPSQGFAGAWGIRAGTSLVPPDVRFGEIPDGNVQLSPPPMFIPSGAVMGVLLRDANGNTIAQGTMTF